MNTPYTAKVGRRTTLQWLAAATILPFLPLRSLAGTSTSSPKGYGTDPKLKAPIVPWSRTMTPHQLQLTAILSDMILPGTESAPSPSTIGIPDFVDEWISAPYQDQKDDREVVLSGLAWVDSESKKQWQCGFLETDDQSRHKILAMMAKESSGTASMENIFFSQLRFIVVGAYYTTPEGFKDIGYIGNVARTSYPSITDKEQAILEDELRKLGI